MSMNMKKLIVTCVLCLCLAVMPAVAQGNSTSANETNVMATVTETLATEPTAAEIATPVPTEAKFRVGPTVRLRPVNDVINTSQDGLVELYMYNPTANDVTLTADVQVSVPSGIHVYATGFASGGAAGTVAGTFTVSPGATRTISINIKSERTGDFIVHFAGLYWPGDDKNAFQQISLTHPFHVEEPSPDPMDPEPTGGAAELPYTYIIVGCLAVIAIVIIAMVIRKPPKTEVVIEEE